MARPKNLAQCLVVQEGRRCSSRADSRGLCRDHYAEASYRVRAGRTSWKELAEKGLALLIPREREGFFDRVTRAKPFDDVEDDVVDRSQDEDEGVEALPRIFAGSDRGGVLLVGEAPNREASLSEEGVDPLAIPRLANLSGLSREDYSTLFGRTNLLDRWPGRSVGGEGDAFPRKEAVAGWGSLLASGLLRQFERVVLLGRRVEDVVLGEKTSFFSWRSSPFERTEAFFSVSPHPSGISRWWNDPENVAAAESFFRFLAAEARHLSSCASCRSRKSFPFGPPRYGEGFRAACVDPPSSSRYHPESSSAS